MGVQNFIQSLRRLRLVIKKPSRKEAWMLIKVASLGVAVLGIIGFMIRVLFWIIGLSPTPTG